MPDPIEIFTIVITDIPKSKYLQEYLLWQIDHQYHFFPQSQALKIIPKYLIKNYCCSLSYTAQGLANYQSERTSNQLFAKDIKNYKFISHDFNSPHQYTTSIIFSYKTAPISMSRNNTVIQNKLLDAFDPIISFKNSASPFQFKEAVRNDIGFAPRTSISRNSYIEVEEKLEEDKTDNLRVGFEANLNFQPNNRKKYLKVMSNSQELRSTSNRKGVQNNKNKNIMKGSCIFQHQKIEKVTWPNEVISAKIVNHHQSCHNLSKQFNFPIRTAPSPPIIRPKSPSFQSQHEQSFAQKSAILKQTEKEGSIQLSEQSKIRILEQLSTDDHILKPKLDKNQYINYTESTSKQLLSRNSSNNSIKIERTENFSSKPQLQIRPRPNFVCVALNNGQPVFQTIVKKDLRILPSNKNLQIQPDICQRSPFILSNQPNFHQLIQPNPMKQIVLGEQKQKMCGRVNNLMFTETSNIRNKIAFQVLR